MFRLFKYLKTKEWIFVAICTALVVLQVWVELTLLNYTRDITASIYTAKEDMAKVWTTGGYMLLCAVGSMAIAVVISFFASKVTSALTYRLREAIYEKVESFSMEEIQGFSTASLITRTTNDVSQVGMAFNLSLQLLVKAPVMAIWSICIISQKAWQWSLSTAIAVIVLVLILAVVIVLAVPKFKKIQRLTDDLNGVTKENLEGVRVVRAYNAEDYQAKKFDKANTALTKTHLFTGRVMALMNPGMTLISSGLSLAIYWIGAFLINVEKSPVARISLYSKDMPTYMGYAMQIVTSFMLLIMIFMILPRASVAAKRINEVLGTTPKILDGNISGIKQEGVIEFKNVSFKYPDAQEYVVKNVSFSAHKGETVAFIGSTGSGKSTLINLVPRFYDVTEGEILLDGVNIKDLSQRELHNKIGYVPQRAVLFSGDIKSNIDFGDNGRGEKSMEELQDAASIAQASEFIEGLEEKYDAHVAQGGTNFSGGQKQRIAIARAIARDPEIFIFDDSFSALDYKTDKTLRKELKSKTDNAITFIVAQRIGTIIDADKIIVLDDGNVVGMGKHKELLSSCDVYREIALSQLSKEELAK